jgi:hypothetical protein
MASQQEIDEIIENIFQDICKMYKDIEFDTRDMHDCLIRLMEIVEDIPILIGTDKKKIVIGVIYLIIHHFHIKESEKNKLLYMLSHDIIDMMVDMIVKLTKTQSKINQKQSVDVILDDSKPEEKTNKYHYCCLM